MDLEAGEDAFRYVDPASRADVVEGEIIDIPSDPYADYTFFVDYFRRSEPYDDSIEAYFDRMENGSEVRDLLDVEQAARTIISLMTEFNAVDEFEYKFVDRRFLTRLAGVNPDDEVLQRMEELDLIEVRDGEYRLNDDSDSYWFHYMAEDIKDTFDEKSLAEAFMDPTEVALVDEEGEQMGRSMDSLHLK